MEQKKLILQFEDVDKRLGKKQVLSQINLEVYTGEVIGIVGSNGSGKTTLLRLVTGLMYPDRGSVRVNGKRIQPGLVGELPERIGALIENPAFLPNFSGLQNLKMLAEIRGKIDTIRKVGLDPTMKKPVRTYSLGMRQRLGIAQAIMEEPDILLLDEPTNGLDVDGVEMFSHIIEELTARGTAILMVSHQKEEIDRFCDRVFQINQGKLTLLRSKKERKWQVIVSSLEEFERVYHLIPSFTMTERVNGYPTGICSGEWETAKELYAFLQRHRIQVREVREAS
jgi:ABC-2 type transport system ATP-binding protein